MNRELKTLPTKEELNQKALQVYAALGELHTKSKQLNQILQSYAAKINELEGTLAELSQQEAALNAPAELPSDKE